jgi:PEP-CTERM motif
VKKLLVVAAVILVFCLAVGGSAKADSFTAGDVFLTGNVTGITATLTIKCLDSGCNGWYLGDVTLKGFTFTSLTGTGAGTPAGYVAQLGGQNNSAVGTGGGCNSTQPTSAICWDTQNVPLSFQLAAGQTYAFTANINGGSFTPGSLHVQATAYNNSAGSQQNGGKVFAISDNLLVVQTPEPSSLGLLVAGLMGLAFVSLRRLRFNS